MTGFEFFDTAKHRPLTHHQLQRQIVFERYRINFASHLRVAQQGLDFGSVNQLLTDSHPIQRFDAKSVSSGQQTVAALIVQHEGKHAVETRHRIGPPLQIGSQQHLGVGRRCKAMPQTDQLSTQLTVVVDLTIEHQADAFGLHRLRAPGHIDDGQTFVMHRHARADQHTVSVRAAMFQGRGHVIEQRGRGRAFRLRDDYEAAHQ